MRATFEIDAKLVVVLHDIAERRGISTSALVEEAIRAVAGLASPPEPAASRNRPLPSWPMGTPLVDISDRGGLYALLDADYSAYSLNSAPVEN